MFSISALHSLVAFEDCGSFSAAARQVHLTHSAISVQMRQLEEQAGSRLFDRHTRPPGLTPLGRQYVQKAREILAKVEELKALSRADSTEGAISCGFVPTTLQGLLPEVLRALRTHFPQLQVNVRSGLSQALAQAVADGELDFAFITAPLAPRPDVRYSEIAQEPLYVIAAPQWAEIDDAEQLLRIAPYVAFERHTWLGQQIAASLQARAPELSPTIELDAIDAIEHLVAQGFGVSVVPQRIFHTPLFERLHCLPYGDVPEHRRLVLASHPMSHRETLRGFMLEHLQQQSHAH